MGRLPVRARALGLAMVVILTLLASYVVVGREYVAALDTFVMADPTLSFTASRSAAPSGTVVHLAGAPAGALAEFSGDGFVAYSPVFTDSTGTSTVVPPLFARGALAGGDAKLRILTKGLVWTSSAKTAFTIEAPAPVSGSPGVATLFGLHVIRGLLEHAEGSAAAAAAAGAPSAVSDQAAGLAELRVEIEALAAGFEGVASGKSTSVTRSEVTIDAAGIALMDQLMASYFTALGPASPSPCGDEKDGNARRGLAATAVAGLKELAALFVQSLVGCNSPELHQVAERTSAWAETLKWWTVYAILEVRDFPKVATLVLTSVGGTADLAGNATYMWKEYELGANLRTNIFTRRGQLLLGEGEDLYVTYEGKKVRLPDYLRVAAEADTHLAVQIERLREQRAFEASALQAVMDHDEADQALEPTPTPSATITPTPTPSATVTPTPSPSATPTAALVTASPTPAPTLAIVSLPPTPAALSYGTVVPPPMTAGKAVSFGFCVPKPVSATALCGPGSANPKGGNPPYTFTYGVPRPLGLTFNSNGLVTGTPTASGPFDFQVCVKDLSGASICRNAVGSVAPAPTPTPAACAGAAFAGTTWAGTLTPSNYTASFEFTFGQPIVYSFGGCNVPIASVKVNDPERTWGLSTTYRNASNALSCSETQCTGFSFTFERRSGPPTPGWDPRFPPSNEIIHVYAVSTLSASAISGSAGIGNNGPGGCCGGGTFTVSKR